MTKKLYWIVLLSLFIFNACSKMEKADLLLINAKIYTVDSAFHIYSSMAVRDGKILALGKDSVLKLKYKASQVIDMKAACIYPGFIDAHCHFYGYGMNQLRADLQATLSFEEVIERLKTYRKNNPELKWIVGRGWDQNDWKIKEFPDNKELDRLFPDIPVYLIRIDGHAAVANSKALKLAGIDEKTKVEGGKIEQENGHLTGILLDNAMDLVVKVIPAANEAQQEKALLHAEKDCFRVGLTTVSDAGLDYSVVKLIDNLQKQNKLKMRIYAMLSPTGENMENFVKKGIYKTNSLDVRSIKLYADGALGSRGACLLEPYCDKKQSGMMLYTDSYYNHYLALAYKYNYQINTHAIGDSANRHILKLYGQFLATKNDRRWRIEHAQVVNENDFVMFGKYSIVPSVQPTHATSDMYWAGDRLGDKRLKFAYAYKYLLEQNGWIAAGSDFPVEDINPLYGFYAAVFRIDKKGYPKGGFQIENSLTREQALRAMTIWAAKSNFEEKEKGSLEVGKFADFVVLDQDIMVCNPETVLQAKVTGTYLGGQLLYQPALKNGE